MRTSTVFACAVSLVIGAGLNEYATKERNEGIYHGLAMVGEQMIRDYAERAAAFAEVERARDRLCSWPLTRHNILWIQNDDATFPRLCEEPTNARRGSR